MGAACVSEKSTIKCSSMKSGVFPFALVLPEWGADGDLSTLNPHLHE